MRREACFQPRRDVLRSVLSVLCATASVFVAGCDSDPLDGPPRGMSLAKEASSTLLVAIREADAQNEKRQVFRVHPFEIGDDGVGLRFTDESIDFLEWADDSDGAHMSFCDPEDNFVYWHGTLAGDLQSHNCIFMEKEFDTPEQYERLKARLMAGSRHAESKPR